MSGLDDFPSVEPIDKNNNKDQNNMNIGFNKLKTEWNCDLILKLILKGFLWFSVVLMFFFMFYYAK